MQWMQEDSRLEDYIEVNGCTRPRQPLSKRELLNAMHDHTGNVRASMEVVEDPSFKESLNEQVYAGGYPQPDKLCKPHRGRK